MSVLSASRRTNPFSSLLKDPALLMSVIVIWFFLLLFIVYPLVRLLILTFEADGLRAIKDTLIIAGIGMVAGGFYGVIVGYLVAKKIFISRQAMEVVSMLNYSLPGTIVGIAYLEGA
jgi:iron(III) transport system permease protein